MSSSTISSPEVRTGLDVLVAQSFRPWRGLRLGVICNPTTVDRRLSHLADLLADRSDLKLVRLFGPEHGVRGTAQDMIGVDGVARDGRSGVPVVSLYGGSFESLAPSQEALADLDALVFDVQDVGSRYYTYIYTMMLCMEAAARAKIAVWVLDRPNPVGGVELEGNLVQEGFQSFVGMHPLPVRHGMTAGELAALFKAERRLDCELHVVAMEGWRRAMLQDETGLPWIPPSPNMPTLDTALCYAGQCLLEGTNLSEGRGTTRPFEIFGAPFVDPHALAERLGALDLPGVAFRPLWFQPTFHKHAGQPCGGLMLHVTDRRTYRPFATGLAVIAAARELWPREFRWRTERYEFVEDRLAFDLLCGTDEIRRAIEAGRSVADLCASWASEQAAFAKGRAPYLRYE
ncbi:MAG: exo-beta-N-acetylmuramidase NamZ family protein [Myxococcales bacterium]